MTPGKLPRPHHLHQQGDSSALTTTSTSTQSSSDSSTTTTVNGVNCSASVCPRTSPQSISGGDNRKKKSKREVHQGTRREASEGLWIHQVTKQSQIQAKAKSLPQPHPNLPQHRAWNQEPRPAVDHSSSPVPAISRRPLLPPWTHMPRSLPSLTMVQPACSCHQLKVISSNVRGLRTNLADLYHNCVQRHNADIVVMTETWLNSEVEPMYGRMYGFTYWARRDCQEQAEGGVAVCFKEGMQAQQHDIDMSPLMESPESLQYLTEALDNLMLAHSCSHVLIVGDLNPHLKRDGYKNLLEVQGLTDHVTFPTHEQGGTLDPVISDYQDGLQCHQLGLMGSSDHHAVLIQLVMGVVQDKATTRTI
ncbi:hypothetical protein E2C01_019867 [Portunus trituberculatus]|uniref:Endonuclease/exonuclease/phosphatase domain-containing protein n=1 Tax=Portunus trituberculatus TaxID=210409 RepID=A0A5B7DYS5_PORTR|nr:hypothetical protein [Portunus trituberculatus]